MSFNIVLQLLSFAQVLTGSPSLLAGASQSHRAAVTSEPSSDSDSIWTRTGAYEHPLSILSGDRPHEASDFLPKLFRQRNLPENNLNPLGHFFWVDSGTI